MSVPIRSRQPRPEARVALELLSGIVEEKERMDDRALQDRVIRFVALLQHVSGKMVRWKWDLSPADLKEVRGALAYGIGRFRAGEVFHHPAYPEGPEQGIVREEDGGVGRSPARDLKNLFFDHVFDLLIEVGPWLRSCQRDGCGRLFLYRRPKQAFCSESCAQRVRMVRFLENRKAGKLKQSTRPRKRLSDRKGR